MSAAAPARAAEADAPRIDLDTYPPYLMSRVVAGVHRKLGDALRPRGLTFQHWRVLLILANRGARTVNALAEDTLIPQSTLSRLLMRMEKGGFVRRAHDPGDSRLVTAEITPKGAATFAAVLPLADDIWAATLAALPPAERAQLGRNLQRLAAQG